MSEPTTPADPHFAEVHDPEMIAPERAAAHAPPAGQDTVQEMHEVLLREQSEPRDGFEPVPFWVTMIFGGLLAWGGFYLGTNSADFRRDVFDRSDVANVGAAGLTVAAPDPDPQTLDDLMKIGQVKYQNICGSCHMPDGKGKPGEGIPPLRDSEWVVGNEASPGRQARIVLYGLSGPLQVQGRTFNGVMPNQGNVLKDYEIASVLTFVRNNKEWGHNADAAGPAMTTALVKAIRAKEGARKTNGTQPMSMDELKKIALDADGPPVAPKKDEPKK